MIRKYKKTLTVLGICFVCLVSFQAGVYGQKKQKYKPQKVIVECQGKKQNGWYRTMPVISWKHYTAGDRKENVFFQLKSLKNGIKTTGKNRIPPMNGEGRYELLAWAEDERGNRSDLTGPLAISIDLTRPGITMKWKEKLTKQKYCRHQSVEIFVEDEHLKEDSVKLETSGKWDGSWEKSKNCWRTTVVFQGEGKQKLEVKASDDAGNQKTESAEFIIDDQPPRIEIQGVKDDYSYKKTVEPKVTAEDLSSCKIRKKVYRNGKEIKQTTLSEDGYYKILVTAMDEAGNQARAEKSFTINKKGIRVHFLEPEIQDKTINRKDYCPSFQYESLDPVQVMGFLVNGQSKDYRMEKDRIRLEKPLKENGKYKLQLILCDASGNYGVSKEIHFFYDTKAPKLKIKGIRKDQTISYGEEIQIAIENEKDFFISVMLDEENMEAEENKISIPSGDLGKHHLTMIASDAAGNITEQKRTFTVEKAVPEVIRNAAWHMETKAFCFLVIVVICIFKGRRIIKNWVTRL